ncbi:MAG: hypothetical protein M1828_006099 [Chrysothrix sp. TS-e1954]|nr:MAG: hypothetical protein M1828_006099 [Chrysothrix sp. TS-e1954]
MDLLQTVRKEGSRGGRANFKWEDVKTDQHRENYLGHSLMAPVGRWQKNKDLSWYSRSSDDKKSEEDARKEELKRIKEAESDALARALGYDVPPRPVEGANATPLNNGEDRMKKESGSEEPATVFQASNGQKLKESKPHRRSSEKRREERPRSRDRRHRRKRDRANMKTVYAQDRGQGRLEDATIVGGRKVESEEKTTEDTFGEMQELSSTTMMTSSADGVDHRLGHAIERGEITVGETFDRIGLFQRTFKYNNDYDR